MKQSASSFQGGDAPTGQGMIVLPGGADIGTDWWVLVDTGDEVGHAVNPSERPRQCRRKAPVDVGDATYDTSRLAVPPVSGEETRRAPGEGCSKARAGSPARTARRGFSGLRGDHRSASTSTGVSCEGL